MKHPTALRGLELGYGILGIATTSWAVMRLPGAWYLPTTGLVIAAAILSFYSIRLNDPVRLPGAMPIEMATLLLAPPAVSILVAASTNLFTSIRYRRNATRTLFNVANLAIPNGLAASWLHLAIEPRPGPLSIPRDLLPVATAILIRMIANLLGTAGILKLEGKIAGGYWQYVKESLGDEWRSGGFGIRILPLLMALAFPVAGWWALLLGALLQIAIGGSMQRYQERIERQTLLDGLTGLGNRKAWDQYRRSQQRSPHLVAVLDVNGLKRTNDTYGHDRGDEILMDLAQRLVASIDHRWQGSRVFRVGGDEFVIATPGTDGYVKFCSDVEDVGMEYSQNWARRGVPASISVGFASVPTDAADLAVAFTVADHRMYRVKSGSVDGAEGVSD